MSDETPDVRDFIPPEDYARMKGLGWIKEDGSVDWRRVALTNLPEHVFVCPVCCTQFTDDDATAADAPLYCSDACTAAAHNDGTPDA